MKVYKYKINGNDYTVKINGIDGNTAEVVVNDALYTVNMEAPAPAMMPKPTPTMAAVPSTDTHPSVARTASPASGNASGVKSPLPGVILQMLVAPGDQVKVGQKLLVLEAMKMENNIDSDREGTVKSVNVRQGDSVLEGDVLLTIE